MSFVLHIFGLKYSISDIKIHLENFKKCKDKFYILNENIYMSSTNYIKIELKTKSKFLYSIKNISKIMNENDKIIIEKWIKLVEEHGIQYENNLYKYDIHNELFSWPRISTNILKYTIKEIKNQLMQFAYSELMSEKYIFSEPEKIECKIKFKSYFIFAFWCENYDSITEEERKMVSEWIDLLSEHGCEICKDIDINIIKYGKVESSESKIEEINN